MQKKTEIYTFPESPTFHMRTSIHIHFISQSHKFQASTFCKCQKKNWLPHIIISILTFKLPMHLVARHKSPTPMLGRKFSLSLMRGHWWWMWPWGLVFNRDFSGQSQLGECVCDEPLASIIDEPFTMPDYVLVMSRCEHKEWIFAFDL